MLPVTDENVAKAKSFVLQKWQERERELGRPEPADLVGACKFASLFAQRVFGGRLRGNWYHQFVELDQDLLDLTDYDPETDPHLEFGRLQGWTRGGMEHDPRFWGHREHREAMASCDVRVSQWVEEFFALQSRTANVSDLKRALMPPR